MRAEENKYKNCFELNIKDCNTVSLGFPIELIYLEKLNINRTKLTKIENLCWTPNISSLNLSNNQLKKIPDIYSLTKLQMLFLNDNFINNVEFDHFKDLRNLQIINLKNNQVMFKNVNNFISNMTSVKDKLKQLKDFEFSSNPYYAGAPKEKIKDFLQFYKKSFLNNLNFETEKMKLEKEFKSKMEEIESHQQRQEESLSARVDQIKKLIEAFSLNPNSIEMKLEQFKESTNNFLLIMNSSANHSKLISAKSTVEDEADKIQEHFQDIIRDLMILTDKVDNKAFTEQCMHFLVGNLRIKDGFLAIDIMSLLIHIAGDRNMEDVLIKNLIKNFTGKEHIDYNIKIDKGEKDQGEKNALIEEIDGHTMINRGTEKADEEEISLASILKTYPEILKSFQMIVNEKYDLLFVYLFRILLRNIKYKKFLTGLPTVVYETEGKGNGFAKENSSNDFIVKKIEFFLICFSGKAKRRILQSLHRYEIMKLIAIAIGIFRLYEFYLKDSGNQSSTYRSEKKIPSEFLKIVAAFGKIFKSILKYFFMPYLNKKVFSDSNELEKNKFVKYLKAASSYSKKDIHANNNNSNYDNSNNIDKRVEEISDYDKQKYIGEYLQSNFKTVINEIINKDTKKNNIDMKLKFDSLTDDNFSQKFEEFLKDDVLEKYKQNIMLYRQKENSNKSSNECFILSNQIMSYFLKINVLIKSAFFDAGSISYMKSLNDFYMILYKEFAKRLDDGGYGENRNEKSRTINNLRNNNNMGIFIFKV